MCNRAPCREVLGTWTAMAVNREGNTTNIIESFASSKGVLFLASFREAHSPRRSQAVKASIDHFSHTCERLLKVWLVGRISKRTHKTNTANTHTNSFHLLLGGIYYQHRLSLMDSVFSYMLWHIVLLCMYCVKCFGEELVNIGRRALKKASLLINNL